jgi:hypothetical protein
VIVVAAIGSTQTIAWASSYLGANSAQLIPTETQPY